MKLTMPLVFSLFWTIAAAAAAFPAQPGYNRSELPRLVLYYQTTHDAAGRPISLLPLITKQHIAVTHLIVAAFHIHANNSIHLNDHPPDHTLFHTLWNETRILQQAGVKVLGMVGGAARGSFSSRTLDSDGPDGQHSATFERAYALLRDTVASHNLDGVDLDVEEPMSQRGMARLVRRLRADFGRGFIITLAPVASALLPGKGRGRGGGGNLSGFDYGVLEEEVGREIAFYNAQFYNGFGSAAGTGLFDRLVLEAGWDPRRIVVGQLTSPANGVGFIRHDRLGRSIRLLRRRYGEIGGVAGWEYFNGVPGGLGQPWRWAQAMTGILRPGSVPGLRITRGMAEGLNKAWVVSAGAAAAGVGESDTAGRWVTTAPNIDYLGMVNFE